MHIIGDVAVMRLCFLRSLAVGMRIDFYALVMDLLRGVTDQTVDGITLVRMMDQMMKALLNNIVHDAVNRPLQFVAIGSHKVEVLEDSR